VFESGSGPGGSGGSNPLSPKSVPSSRPSLDDQRDGHTYRLHACIGAGSSHCEREGSRRRSRRRWWWSRASSAAADAKQHSERASRKDPAWNLPPGSFAISKQNYYQQADGQRPGTNAEVGRGRPQHRPRRQLCRPGGGSHGHRGRVASSGVRAETCRSRPRQSGNTEGQIIGETCLPRDSYGVICAGAGGDSLRRRCGA
jgi:hypothetical protein